MKNQVDDRIRYISIIWDFMFDFKVLIELVKQSANVILNGVLEFKYIYTFHSKMIRIYVFHFNLPICSMFLNCAKKKLM